jgi:septal ring factor EnvC (AmiA/AmiB activator)
MAHQHKYAKLGRQEPFMQRLHPTQVSAVLIALLLSFNVTAKPPSSQTKTPAAPPPEIAEKQADLGELRGRIESLRKDLNASEENKADAASRLRDSERKISDLQRELHEFSEQRARLQKTLKNLELQSQELGATLGQQQSQLEQLLYKQYLRGTPDSLQLLLNGDDPNQMARDLHYLSAIALTRAELMGEINATLDKKKSLANSAKERNVELALIESEQQKRHAELQKQREERKALYAEVSNKVNSQRKEIGNLQQDEKRLTQLIDRVSKLLAAQAAQAARAAEAAKAAEAARLAEAARQKNKPSATTSESPPTRPQTSTEPPRAKPVETENNYEPVANNGNFAKQKGNLRLPVRGTVAGRFGAPREGGGTWRGLFIKAPTGSEIKAVANGRVVFAEWMRGFGNLLIVDHGDAYLSIYGNNDSMLKQVGQAVKGGETVATAGNSGGNPDSGLYFELRHQGQPIDPMKWASLK